MQLPTTPLPPTRLSPKLLYLYGSPKVGKTSALAQLPGCLILETDSGGADFVTALKVQLTSLKDFDEAVSELIKQNKPYKYVALDTATKFEEWCEGQATEMYKESPIGKNFKGASVLTLPEGAGYLWLRLAFQQNISRLLRCADHVIMTGHLKDKFLKSAETKEKGKDALEVASRDIDHTGKIKSMITAGADAIGFLFRTSEANDPTKQKLKVTFKTSEIINCGTRCEYLAGKEFTFDWKEIYRDLQ